MKEVIIATGTLGGGGAERVFLNIANEISKRGINVRVLVTGSRPVQGFPLDDAISTDQISSSKANKILKVIDKFIQFRKYFKAHQNATVISFFPDVSAYCVFSSFGIHNKNIVSERNDPNTIPRKAYMKKIRNAAFEFADSCVFQTKDAELYFSRKVQSKAYIIGNPIDSARLPMPNDIASREKIIIAVGRIVPQKNFMMLIQAWELIEREFPDYVLHIYGDTSYHDGVFTAELQRYIDDHKLNERIEFRGFTDDIYNIMNKAAVYVSSSDFEGMSNTMLEAMAMGVPTIATDCPIGGARAVIRNGQNGILIPVGEKMEMAKALADLLNDEGQCRKLANESVKIRDTMSIRKICDEWMDLL